MEFEMVQVMLEQVAHGRLGLPDATDRQVLTSTDAPETQELNPEQGEPSFDSIALPACNITIVDLVILSKFRLLNCDACSAESGQQVDSPALQGQDDSPAKLVLATQTNEQHKDLVFASRAWRQVTPAYTYCYQNGGSLAHYLQLVIFLHAACKLSAVCWSASRMNLEFGKLTCCNCFWWVCFTR